MPISINNIDGRRKAAQEYDIIESAPKNARRPWRAEDRE